MIRGAPTRGFPRCRIRCSLVLPLLVLLLLLSLSWCSTAAYAAASHSHSHVDGGRGGIAESAVVVVVEATTTAPPSPHLDEQQEEEEEAEMCSDFPFSLFLAAAMGRASTTQALTTCDITPYSTLLHDVALSLRHRDAAESVAGGLWRLTHGNAAPLTLFDNAHVLLSLRAEMESWIRANRTVGMSPSAYEAVVRGVSAVLGLNETLFTTPTVPLPAEVASSPSTTAVNWTQRFQQCADTASDRVHARTCVLQVAQDAYRVHANATLRTPSASSSLLVSNATFARAQRYYEHAVFPSVIVRSFDLDPSTTTAKDFDRNLHGLLRGVQHLWDDVAQHVAQDEARDLLPTPYLPFVRETDITGPTRREALDNDNSGDGSDDAAAAEEFGYPAPSRTSGMRLQPLRRILPAAVLYQTGADCRSCDLYDQAFELLPAVYKRMCSRGYRSIVSCSPIALFLRSTHVRRFQQLPSVEVYARQAHSRAAVLRFVDRDLRTLFKESPSAEKEGGRSGAASRESNEEEKEEEEEDTRGSAFYSLRARYDQSGVGIEEAVLPRSQFSAYRVPLRMQTNVATVEDAVVGIVGDLVGTGVIQFLFLDKAEVARIARENARVTRMIEEERLQQQQQQQQQQRTELEGEEADAAKPAVPPAPSTSPTPSLNAEDHPQYRKVVSFRDLSTKLVQAHTRALFGDVRRASGGVGSSPSSSQHLRSSSKSSSSWLRWWPSWLSLTGPPRALWALILGGVERPLYLTVFVLLCLYQRWWNRSQRVSYW